MSRNSYVCVVESCVRMFVYLVVFRTCMHVHSFDSILCTQPSNCCVPESNVSRDVQILPVCVLCLWVLWLCVCSLLMLTSCFTYAEVLDGIYQGCNGPHNS